MSQFICADKPDTGYLDSTEPCLETFISSVSYGARDINIYELKPLYAEHLPPSEPGAHIDLVLPSGLTRQYSLLEAADHPKSYKIAVKRDPQSRGGSRFLHEQARVGAKIIIHQPRNNFKLLETAPHSILIAGGIGVTPIYSMIRKLTALGRPWTLYYACRARADAVFFGELSQLKNVHFHFDIENSGEVLDIGRVVASAPPGTNFYCCGPLPMLDAFKAATADIPSNCVHVEYFSGEPAKIGETTFVVELLKSSWEFTVPPDKSILEVLLEAGLELQHSCLQGVCGACETGVISGVPDHRDMLLTDDDKRKNKSMMICCSRSKSGRLVLDL